MSGMYEIPLERTASTPVSEGIHVFGVSNIEEGESSSGNPMWTVRCACKDPGEEGKEATLYLVLTEAARWKFELFLDAVKAPATGTATADKFIGRQFRAQITHEDYQGRLQPRIGEMWPITAAPPATAPKAAVVVKNKPDAAATKTPAKTSAPVAVKKVAAKQPTGSLPADAAGSEDEIPY